MHCLSLHAKFIPLIAPTLLEGKPEGKLAGRRSNDRLTLLAVFANPAWHTDTLARDRITAVRVDAVTLLLTVDAPCSRLTVCSK